MKDMPISIQQVNSIYILKQNINIFKRWYIKFKNKKIDKYYELEDSTWYLAEVDDFGSPFIWSKPSCKINLKNTENIRFKFRCPVDNEILIRCGSVSFEKKFFANRIYKIDLETIGEDSIYIVGKSSFTAEDDPRKLGLCFFDINVA